MDLLQRLAVQSSLSEEERKLVSQISKEEVKVWVMSHLKVPMHTVKHNLHLLHTLHANDLLLITTYLQLCKDKNRNGFVVDIRLAHYNALSGEDLRTTADILSILMPFYIDFCVTLGEPVMQFVGVVEKELPYNRIVLAPLVSYLVTSPYRGVPWHLHQFLEDLQQRAQVVEPNILPSRPSLEELITCQEQQWKDLHSHQQYLFYVEIFKVFTTDKAFYLLECYKDTLTAMMLHSAFLHTSYEEHVHRLHNLVEGGFRSCLSAGEVIEDIRYTIPLIKWMLLIRHLCLEQVKPYYISYAYWFNNLQIKSKEEFEFFFAVLSRMVPREDATYLKIHINKAPIIPRNCQTVFSNYCQLARTRLIDMKESTEYLGLFGTTKQEDRREDVLNILSHYRHTGEIAPILLKACVFRRKYYLDIFLRDLLTFCNESNETWRDTQKDLIEALLAAGKLPRSMYDEWTATESPNQP